MLNNLILTCRSPSNIGMPTGFHALIIVLLICLKFILPSHESWPNNILCILLFLYFFFFLFSYHTVYHLSISFFSHIFFIYFFTHFTKHIIIVLLIALGFHKSGLGRLGCKLLRCLDYFHLTYIRLFPPELNGLIERNYHLYSHFSSLKCHLFLFYKNIFDEN